VRATKRGNNVRFEEVGVVIIVIIVNINPVVPAVRAVDSEFLASNPQRRSKRVVVTVNHARVAV